ncbi:tetratricopeptide repeat protein [Methylocystis hirsuta]|uniref:Tetratricopeptide repeat protein n=1 Tax=Methylocystis hirsuta TaxID=369798 RepID=A0A3M9XQT4_9HYPH|nr:tetratricopeptide repeat protein [Methylocystis hirsuta]RNJ50394.1 tetratricopeptide repeat protein [Methylocystis hirsuta]
MARRFAALIVAALSVPSPNSLASSSDLLKQCLEKGDSDAALAVCSNALQISSAPNEQANILIRQCVAYADKADYSSAKQACNEAIRKNVNNSIAYFDLGNVFLREQRYRDAIDYFDKATEINKSYANAYSNKCYTYNYLRDYEHAIGECNKAIALDPRQPRYFIGRGNAFLNSGNNRKAEADYRTARELNPDDQSALVGLAAVLQKHGDYSAALKLLDQIKLDREDAPTALNNRCWYRAISTSNRSELEIALRDCDQALKILPSAAWIINSRAFVYLKLGDFNKATIDYKQALLIEPAQASALYGYGVAKKLGGDATADVYIKSALDLEIGIADEFAQYGIEVK